MGQNLYANMEGFCRDSHIFYMKKIFMLIFCTHYHQVYIYIMTPTMYFVEFITFNHCIHHIPNLIKKYCRFTQNFSIHFQNSCLCGMPCTKVPIMLALCSKLLPSYYAPNYAGIIGSGLVSNINLVCNNITEYSLYMYVTRFDNTWLPYTISYKYLEILLLIILS